MKKQPTLQAALIYMTAVEDVAYYYLSLHKAHSRAVTFVFLLIVRLYQWMAGDSTPLVFDMQVYSTFIIRLAIRFSLGGFVTFPNTALLGCTISLILRPCRKTAIGLPTHTCCFPLPFQVIGKQVKFISLLFCTLTLLAMIKISCKEIQCRVVYYH